jgi:hypothetical protein
MRSFWTMGLRLKLIQTALVFLDIRLAVLRLWQQRVAERPFLKS